MQLTAAQRWRRPAAWLRAVGLTLRVLVVTALAQPSALMAQPAPPPAADLPPAGAPSPPQDSPPGDGPSPAQDSPPGDGPSPAQDSPPGDGPSPAGDQASPVVAPAPQAAPLAGARPAAASAPLPQVGPDAAPPAQQPVQEEGVASAPPSARVQTLPDAGVQTLPDDGWPEAAELPPQHFDPVAYGASEESGQRRWSGALRGQLGYFWENSTRVVMPGVELELQSPTGLRLRAGYLVDVITSASIGFGVTEDDLHQEKRHQLGVGVGKELSVASDVQVDVQVDARVSTEPDYTSLPFISGTVAVSANERNTVLRLGASLIRDTILSNNDQAVEEKLTGYSGTVGIEQVLNRYMVATVAYQIAYLDGFLGNVYRLVQIESAPLREDPPDTRTRHAVSARLQGIVPATGTALHLLGKLYTDSWGVDAVSPEVRLYQSLGGALLTRLRYRHYDQSRADFQRSPYLRGWDGNTTSDPKLAAFASHMVGVRLDLFLRFFSDTVLDFAEGGSVYVSFDKQFTDISYGDAEIGTVGGMLPF